MKKLTVAIVGMLALGLGSLAQPVPGGPGPMGPGPVSLEQVVEVLSQEMDWLQGLAIDARGWDAALSALQGALEELQAAEGTPAPDTVVQLNASLHLVVDILERTAFQSVRERLQEGRQGPPEWLEGYLDEATAGMGPEDAARVRAIVRGLLGGIRAQVGEFARERHGGERPAGLPGRPEFGPARVRQAMPEEMKAWIEGYLAGATAGMGPEEARQVREICQGAIRAGFEFHREQRAELEENLRHFLRLRGIAAGLDILILQKTTD